MKVSRARVTFQVVLHVVLIGHVLAYYFLDWTAVGALDFQAFFHHFLGRGLLTAGALLTLAAFVGAFFFGRLFCSWGCHFGATQDLAAWVLRRVGWKPPLVHTRFLHGTPYLLLVVIFLQPAVLRWWSSGWGPVEIDMAAVAPWDTLPGWFLSVVTFVVCGAGVLLFLGTRGFCRFVCPYGAVFRVADRFTPFRVRRVGACSSDCATGSSHPCTTVCPTAIDVHDETDQLGYVANADCVRCHLCIEACPTQALAYRARAIEPTAGPAPAAAPAPAVFTLPLWGELLVGVVAIVTYVCVDLVYGGHFLAASAALAEGFLAFVALGTLCAEPQTVLGQPLRQGKGWTFVGITVLGVLALSGSPIFSAGAFKWCRTEALRLDPDAAVEPSGSDVGDDDRPPALLKPEARQRLRQAVVYYERALDWIPFAGETRLLLVSAYVRLGDGQKAVESAEALVRHSAPGDPRARATLDWVQARFSGTPGGRR